MRKYKNSPQLSPCIISRAKFHLGIPNRYRFNNKPCSDDYWNKTIDALIRLHSVSTNRISRARRMKDVLK